MTFFTNVKNDPFLTKPEYWHLHLNNVMKCHSWEDQWKRKNILQVNLSLASSLVYHSDYLITPKQEVRMGSTLCQSHNSIPVYRKWWKRSFLPFDVPANLSSISTSKLGISTWWFMWTEGESHDASGESNEYGHKVCDTCDKNCLQRSSCTFQVFVANHTSMIDFVILEQMTAFAVIMQKHPGWVGEPICSIPFCD